jgi:hypothetical protein
MNSPTFHKHARRIIVLLRNKFLHFGNVHIHNVFDLVRSQKLKHDVHGTHHFGAIDKTLNGVLILRRLYACPEEAPESCDRSSMTVNL